MERSDPSGWDQKAAAKNVHMVEWWYGVCVDLDYPLMKFNSQLENIQDLMKIEKEIMEAAVNGGIGKSFKA